MTEPRVYTLELPAGLPLLNANGRQHWAKKNPITQALRQAACITARNAKVPPLGRIHVTGWYYPATRRRVDPANFYPSFKACVDGLVDARVVEDDDSTRVLGPDMRLGDKQPKARLVLEIREVLT